MALIPEHQAQPIAWLRTFPDPDQPEITHQTLYLAADYPDWDKQAWADGVVVTPLYASPPRRGALSLEAIHQIAAQVQAASYENYSIALARAVEGVHGVDAAAIRADRMITNRHRSRQAPACVDCAHFMPARDAVRMLHGMCNHPSTALDPVTGEPETGAKSMRGADARRAELFGRGHCGPDGLLFAIKTAGCATCGGKRAYRPPFGSRPSACPDCLTRPISNASATTSAVE